MEASKLTNSEKLILSMLKEYGPLAPEKLRKMLNMSTSTFYYAITRLQVKGLIEKITIEKKTKRSYMIRCLLIPKRINNATEI